MEFFVAGGFAMWFVLVFGLVALGSAIRFALHPAPGRVGPIVAYGAAVALVSVAGLGVDLMATFRFSAQLDDPDERTRAVMQGIAESMSPPVLGFVLLALVAMVTALGLRRMPPA